MPYLVLYIISIVDIFLEELIGLSEVRNYSMEMLQ